MSGFRSILASLGPFGRSKLKAAVDRRAPAVAAAPKRSPAYSKAFAQGAKDYRTRCRAILESAEAKGRYQSALSLALDTDLSAALCIQYLREQPRRASLAQVMASVPNPDVGPGLAEASDGEPTAEQINNVARRIAAAGRDAAHPSKP